MGSGDRVVGQCCICGQTKELSFEHVPPEKAFNDKPTMVYNIFKGLGYAQPPGRYTKKPRGTGDYTLCESCNKLTGSWYAPHFIGWVWDAYRLFSKAGGPPSLYFPFTFYPLRVFKQIVAMFCSTCGPSLIKSHPQITKFLLNKEERAFPRDTAVYTFAHRGTCARYAGMTGHLRMEPYGLKKRWFSELAFPPLGFLLSVNSEPPDERLLDITFFQCFDYHTPAEIWLRFPKLDVHSPLPGDYRTDEVIKQGLMENLVRVLREKAN